MVFVISPTNVDSALEFHFVGDLPNNLAYRVFGGKYSVQTTAFALAVSNRVVDLYLSLNSGGDASKSRAATNGIDITTIASTTFGQNIGALGGGAASVHPYKGYIREWLFYTNFNVVTNAVMLAAIHKYMTNTYTDITP
jgi:hypothetical protein